MSTEIAIQLQTVQDRVRDRIQTEFMSLIPQEVWEKMVNDEIRRFLAEPSIDSYGRCEPNTAPTLRDLVRETLNKTGKAKIEAELKESHWSGRWKGTEYEVSEAIKKLVIEHGDLIWKTMMTGMMQSVTEMALQQFRQQLQNLNPGFRTY